MMGSVLALPLCGFLCKYGFDEGWASIFYVIGECCHVEVLIALKGISVTLFITKYIFLLYYMTFDSYCIT